MKFPTVREEITATQQQFYEDSRFPGVLGAIDGTHIYIRSPDVNGFIQYKDAVIGFNKILVKDLKGKLPFQITHIDYWSDGVTSQLKRRYCLQICYNTRKTSMQPWTRLTLKLTM